MAEANDSWASPEEGRDRTGRALAAFRERRRSRRSPDTYFGSTECLLTKADAALDRDEVEERRSELVAEAEAAGMSRELAEALYDVAREEGLHPWLGYELVRCGVGVRPPPEGVSNAPEHPTMDRYRPEWLRDPLPADDLLRERTLRLSFRRLRMLLDRHPDPDDAVRAFADEPDVGPCGF